MSALLAIASFSTALAAGCWEPPTNVALGRVQTGQEEILVGDLVCEVGSLDAATYRAGCMDDAGNASFISVTEKGDTAIVTWNDEPPVTYRRCPNP